MIAKVETKPLPWKKHIKRLTGMYSRKIEMENIYEAYSCGYTKRNNRRKII